MLKETVLGERLDSQCVCVSRSGYIRYVLGWNIIWRCEFIAWGRSKLDVGT